MINLLLLKNQDQSIKKKKDNKVLDNVIKQMDENPLSPIKSLKGTPVPYEIQFDMSNRSDCQDWIEDNKESINNIIPLTILKNPLSFACK